MINRFLQNRIILISTLAIIATILLPQMVKFNSPEGALNSAIKPTLKYFETELFSQADYDNFIPNNHTLRHHKQVTENIKFIDVQDFEKFRNSGESVHLSFVVNYQQSILPPAKYKTLTSLSYNYNSPIEIEGDNIPLLI